jgi:hypothetical protein
LPALFDIKQLRAAMKGSEPHYRSVVTRDALLLSAKNSVREISGAFAKAFSTIVLLCSKRCHFFQVRCG